MQVLIHRGEQTNVLLGQRRGIIDLAYSALDLTCARAETVSPAGIGAYPSPPMSGSPPLPPKPIQEAGERGQGSFQSTTRDAYRFGPTIQGGDFRPQPGPSAPQPPLPPPAAGTIRPFQLEPAQRMGYPYRRPEEAMGRPISYPHQPGHIIPPPQYALPPVAGPSPGPSPYSLPARPQPPENPPYASPKSQRKTKGHVASACVPCKKAHLRCDAQRPCSRCLSNGKEDSCIDVQHKKRGRPRLRDDRETRFDGPRFPLPADPTMRRPVSLYGTTSNPAVAYEDPLRRSQSYRVLKSQPPEPIAPRYPERGSASDANIFPAPLSIPARALEPVAFLTIDLEVVRVSNTFAEAIGAGAAQSVQGVKLADLINLGERDRVGALQRSLQEEQGRKEPNYLPPIYGREQMERVIQSIPFDPDTISRFQLDRPEFFTFFTPDGQPRSYPIRVGLAKEDSIYFVVVHLNLQPRPFPHPTPSPHGREPPYSYQPQSQGFTQLTPVSASFDSSRSRFGDIRDHREGGLTRQPATPAPMMAGLSPGMSPNVPSYAPAPAARAEHPARLAYQIPRSELATTRAPQQPAFQLPPIRGPGQPGPSGDPREGRVDIGELIDQPDPTRRGP